MQTLSISRAWEQARSLLVRDGTLIATVALALIALPSAVAEFVSPGATAAPRTPGNALLIIIFGLIAVVGQLAVLRLAMGPSVSVGEAIGHAARRALPYIAAVILIVLALLLLAIPFVAILAAMGVSFEPTAQPPASALIVMLLYFAVAVAAGVKMLMTSPVATAEPVGPIAILKRSWRLTSGHFWSLFGFMILFAIAALIAVTAVGLLARVLVVLALGPIEPLSLGALIVALVAALVSAAATAIFLVMLARIYLQLTDHDAEAGVPSSGT